MFFFFVFSITVADFVTTVALKKQTKKKRAQIYIGQRSETSDRAIQSRGPSGKAIQLINIEKEEERKVDGGRKAEEKLMK